MKKKIKILSLGLSQSNFLFQLYNEILKIDSQFSFSVNNYRDFSNGVVKKDNEVFDNYYSFHENSFTKWELFFTIIKLLFISSFWKFLTFEIKHKYTYKRIKNFIKKQAINKLIVDNIINPLEFDIYQFHYCKSSYLDLLHYLPKNKKIVCSYWGSDLYRENNKRNNFYVEAALRKSSVITIQTPEMAKDLFKKHGNWIKDKIYYAQFAIEKNIYNQIDILRNDNTSLELFKEKYSIPLNHIIIAIGYNANEAFNHIEILKVIDLLDDDLKKRITIILSLTYSRKESYLEKIEKATKKLSNINLIYFHKFISHDEIAKLRLITDIQIQMPISDALSGSVTEVLYSGNIVIAGDWLPYDIFKRNDINYLKINKFEDLKDTLPRVLNSLELLKINSKNNPKNIATHFFPEQTSMSWINLYKSFVS